MEVFINPPKDSWKKILERPDADNSGLHSEVSVILERVRGEGDRALEDLTLKFSGIRPVSLLVPPEEIKRAARIVPPDLKEAIQTARQNIEKFHEVQGCDDRLIKTMEGVKCWTRTVPIERVGLYIPGGTAALFSTVLMLGIPARLAGCTEIVLCSPPDKDGNIPASILYSAGLLGITKIFRVGGAQAIAAMAYGTETVPRVDKIFGPGNRWVTQAKLLVSTDRTAIDMPAGPSELAIIADDTAKPSYIAADLISQAEHGPGSQVLLVSQDKVLLESVQQEIEKQLALLPRRQWAEEALAKSRLIQLENRADILDMVNIYAPEHLMIMCRNYGDAGIRIKNAGSVFMGEFTPVSAGDYASGTNHTLPTGGWAKAFSGLGLQDFQKRITYQEITEEGLHKLGSSIVRMAREEGLQGHGKAVEIRLSKDLGNSSK